MGHRATFPAKNKTTVRRSLQNILTVKPLQTFLTVRIVNVDDNRLWNPYDEGECVQIPMPDSFDEMLPQLEKAATAKNLKTFWYKMSFKRPPDKHLMLVTRLYKQYANESWSSTLSPPEKRQAWDGATVFSKGIKRDMQVYASTKGVFPKNLIINRGLSF